MKQCILKSTFLLQKYVFLNMSQFHGQMVGTAPWSWQGWSFVQSD